METLRALAISRKADDYIFFVVTNANEKEQHVIKYLAASDLPCIEIFDNTGESPIGYRFEGKPDLEEFFDNYHEKKANIILKQRLHLVMNQELLI
jgi:hypothetical protein